MSTKLSTKLEQSIIETGITPKAARIYIAVLELNQASVSQISSQTGLPRTTIYSILPELLNRNLIHTIGSGSKTFYRAQDPTMMLDDLNKKVSLMKETLPELKELYRHATVKPAIRYYVGRDEYEKMYNGILADKKLKQYDIIAREELWVNINPKFLKAFKQRRAQAGIRTRLILEHSPTAQERQHEEQSTLSEVKILPPAFSIPFSGGAYIFKDKVIFTSYQKDLLAVEIVSTEITSIIHMMFQFMWKTISKS